jgi:hypothetical protein
MQKRLQEILATTDFGQELKALYFTEPLPDSSGVLRSLLKSLLHLLDIGEECAEAGVLLETAADTTQHETRLITPRELAHSKFMNQEFSQELKSTTTNSGKENQQTNSQRVSVQSYNEDKAPVEIKRLQKVVRRKPQRDSITKAPGCVSMEHINPDYSTCDA